MIGRVISFNNTPSTTEFYFLVLGDVRKGQFVEVSDPQGAVIAFVNEIFRLNRYFEDPEIVSDYEREGGIINHFPHQEGEYIVALARTMGRKSPEGMFIRSFTPPSPGKDVFLMPDSDLSKFIGFAQEGLSIGTVQNHSTKAVLDFNRTLQKHMAILAMSGAGKSYLTTVIIEELVNSQLPTPAVVVMDMHNEYSDFKHDPSFSKKTTLVDAKEIRIPVTKLNPSCLSEWFELSTPQERLYSECFSQFKEAIREQNLKPSLKNLIEIVEASGSREKNKNKVSTVNELVGRLHELGKMRLVGSSERPKVKELSTNSLLVFNLEGLDSLRQRQIVVSYFGRRLFELRKKNKVPPFLMVIEEAHNFASEQRKFDTISRGIIEKIAREGRKFGSSLCLITQRPSHISNTALSQCNTHIILRMMNPNDLKKVAESCEGIDDRMVQSITTLQVGDAIVVGEAVNFPVFLRIRKRVCRKYTSKGSDIIEQCREFNRSKKEEKEQVESFL
ncbi:MAG: ATP-binding protein [Candidatus Anstonellales archaeon]